MPKKTTQRKRKPAAPKQKQMALLLPQGSEGKKTILHVGCGPTRDKKMLPRPFRGEEWFEVRLDIDPGAKPDIVADIMDMHMIPAGSFDALYSSHNLEHVYDYQVPKVLSEFFRVLKPEGVAVVTLPDLQAVAFHIAEGRLAEPLYQSPSGPIAAIDILYGHGASLQKGHHYMAHKCGFTSRTLGQRLLNAGFCNVKVSHDDGMNLWAQGFKLTRDHPNYKDEAKVSSRYTKMVVPIPDPDLPAGKRADELDVPPQRWKKLGL